MRNHHKILLRSFETVGPGHVRTVYWDRNDNLLCCTTWTMDMPLQHHRSMQGTFTHLDCLKLQII